VQFSALTDMAAMLRDPRWNELAHGVVSQVVIMGGLLESADGQLSMDPAATNNTYDRAAAEFVYGELAGDEGSGAGIELIVVSRHAAGAVRLPKKALDGSSHPTALRLTEVERSSLAKLWTRVHMTQAERHAMCMCMCMCMCMGRHVHVHGRHVHVHDAGGAARRQRRAADALRPRVAARHVPRAVGAAEPRAGRRHLAVRRWAHRVRT